MAKIYLIPNVLSGSHWEQVLPAGITNVIGSLRLFFVEDIRNARRYIKKLLPDQDIDKLEFRELTKRTTTAELAGMVEMVISGSDAGIITEAGCPGVADPGAGIVSIAHERNVRVVPLTGPSSILLALMASGLNGQSFAFHGYLPVKQPERVKRILQLEKMAISTGQTQIFMETPYRNNALLGDLVKSCLPETMLCLAADITDENELIVTQPIRKWKNRLPDLNKRPAIFLLGTRITG